MDPTLQRLKIMDNLHLIMPIITRKYSMFSIKWNHD